MDLWSNAHALIFTTSAKQYFQIWKYLREVAWILVEHDFPREVPKEIPKESGTYWSIIPAEKQASFQKVTSAPENRLSSTRATQLLDENNFSAQEV